MARLLRAQRPGPAALAVLALAALAVFVAGFEHARLFHRGYGPVDVVGPLFLLNGIASALVVLLLVFDRVALFVLGSLAVSAGSLVSILISHTSSFFRFSEAGYDTDATVIVVAEAAAVVLTLLGALLARRGTVAA
jgi:hypothetical protein